MGLEELDKTKAELRALGADIAIVSSYANLTYVTGTEIPLPVGAGHDMSFASPLAVIPACGSGAALVTNGSAHAATEHGYELLTFSGFDHHNPTDPAGTFAAQLKAALAAAGATGASGTIGVESRSLPFVAGDLIREALPGWTVVDIEPALIRARWIKTAREIELLRDASRISDVAQQTLAALAKTAGQSEMGMFAEISERAYEAAGVFFPLTGELVTGERTRVVAYPHNGPFNRITKPGDGALMDLSGRVNGYWFDCTNTHIIGGIEPTQEQRRYGKASQAACEAGMAALKPGAKASDASAAAAAAFASFGLPNAHYTGHQIGVTVNEHPRLVPYDHSVIQAGMVFCVEPGAYGGDAYPFGSRSEKTVLVREDGPEILSTFEWGID